MIFRFDTLIESSVIDILLSMANFKFPILHVAEANLTAFSSKKILLRLRKKVCQNISGLEALRPRPHVSGYFWKTHLFYPYKKYPRPHEERFCKYPRLHEDALWIQTPFFELWQKQTNNQNALAWSPKLRAHALMDGKLTLWHQRFGKAPFSPVHTTTWKRHFQKDPLWRAFSKSFVSDDRKRKLRVDANPKRIKKMRFQKYPDTCGRGLRWHLEERKRQVHL